ncbi:MAG TPA: hypothetical protein VN665_00540, partial [Candidatus Paceibacterota bacterium]|nr:hypothetical protein [Candidatus Paceibacterota bacterium]
MDPQENKQTPPENKKEESVPQSGAGHIDMGSILLPKKEEPGHTVDSAQRVNAGALLEQEIAAGTLGTDTQQQHVAEKAAEVKPEPAPAAPESLVKPLETFQHDIESVVQHDNVSVLTIATAEAERRSDAGEVEPEVKKEKTRSMVLTIAMIMGGFIFLVAASGALAYLVTRTSSVPITTTATPQTPFISVDAVKEITITPDESRDTVMANLDAARQATSLSLGLMSQLLVSESSTTPTGTVTEPLLA